MFPADVGAGRTASVSDVVYLLPEQVLGVDTGQGDAGVVCGSRPSLLKDHLS